MGRRAGRPAAPGGDGLVDNQVDDGREPISSTDLVDFTVDGEPFRLMDVQRGIRKPAVLSAALSIRTVYTPEGKERPYDDEPGPDGMLRYKWRGDDPDHPENRALRAACRRDVPLIWFFGVGQALYLPVFPVYVLGEERAQTRRRLHQPVFRAQVMRAYGTRCCVCALRHRQLLDAAHIVPDSSEQGIAAVRNGLALCKIHHAAFDADILGVSPDLVVAIRDDLLHEIDGPMLRHGLQERHGERLRVVPAMKRERPDPELLGQRFAQFRAAG